MLQFEYAGTILLLISLGLTKFAIVAFVHLLSPRRIDRRLNKGIGVLVLLWLLSSVFVAAFHCTESRIWDAPLIEKCINRVSQARNSKL